MDINLFNPRILYAGFRPAQDGHIVEKNVNNGTYTLELIQPPYEGGLLGFGMSLSIGLVKEILGETVDLMKTKYISLKVRNLCSQDVGLMFSLQALVNKQNTPVPIRIRRISLISQSGREITDCVAFSDQYWLNSGTMVFIPPEFHGVIRFDCSPYNLNGIFENGSLEAFKDRWKESLRDIRVSSLTAQSLGIYFFGWTPLGSTIWLEDFFIHDCLGRISRPVFDPRRLISHIDGNDGIKDYTEFLPDGKWRIKISFDHKLIYTAENNSLFFYYGTLHKYQLRKYSAHVIDFYDHYLTTTSKHFLERLPVKTVVSDVNIYKNLFLQAEEGFRQGGEGLFFAKSALMQILCLLIRHHDENARNNSVLQTCLRIKEYLDKNFSFKISISQLARDEGLVPAYMSRAFAGMLGESPSSYLARIRVEKAKTLLADTSLSIEQIAFDCGFSGTSGFYKIFTRETGMTPARYRTHK